jgi:uncharacterized protein
VKDPMKLIKVGDILEFRIIGLDLDRRRISLSRKSEHEAAPGKQAAPVIPKKQTAPVKTTREKPKKDDDGTMYNPFADAFKKMQGKK